MNKQEQERWDSVLRDHWWAKGHHSIIKDMISRKLAHNNSGAMRCLDVGCSSGRIVDFLETFGYSCGFDISRDALLMRKTHCNNFVQADALRVPFQDGVFDVVTALDVVEHLDDDAALLKEMSRVCARSGLIFIVVPACRFLWGSHDLWNDHKRRYEKGSLIKLAKGAGLVTERVTYLHPHLLLPLLALRLSDRITGRYNKKRDDFLSLGPVVDNALSATLTAERMLLSKINFLFGTSLFGCFRKP